MLGPITYLDAALLLIAFVSGVLAMYRGLSREMLSILSWIAAAGAGAYFFAYQKKLAEDMAQQISPGSPVIIAQIAIAAIVFLVVLIIVHLITTRVSDSILDSRVGVIDRILGFAFGVVRGFILVLIPFMGYQNFFPEKDQHPIVTRAVSKDILKKTGKSLEPPLLWFYERIFNKSQGDPQQG